MPRTVLIVDDSATSGDTLAVALAAIPDIEVRTVSSGEEALRIAASGAVHALITDLHMPYMDGFELIGRMQAEPNLASVPIVVISGDSDVDTPGRVRQLGASAFFSKPFSPAAVRGALERILHAK
jgi:two-component system, chemotaxis family, chemotaxis protein CheY